MAKVKVADYVCVKAMELTLDQSEELEFDAPENTAVNLFVSTPILMFLVRSDSATGVHLSLSIELNKNPVPGEAARPTLDILADATARSYHLLINRDFLKAGARNVLKFTGSDNKAKIVISDVVVWFQQTAG